MNNGDPFLWLLLFFLILTSSFFSGAEIALITLNKNKLEKIFISGTGTKKSRQAKRILALTRQPAQFLATIQVGNTIANFMASAVAASRLSGRFSIWLFSLGIKIPLATLNAFSLVFITVILSFVTMVLCELLPKRIAMKKADALAYPISGLILFISRLFAPVVWLLTKTTNGLLRLIGINPEAEAYAVTGEEIRVMIDVGSAKGTINASEKEILHNVFEFGNKTAGEVMTHRRDMVMLRLEETDEEWERTIIENKHSFFPVCGKKPDDITGVLNVRDYLCLKDRRRETVMAGAVLPPQLVPTSVRIDKLFAKMKKNRSHFAIVFDEHGGIMGIVTMKDLLEELVGNLDDDSSMPPDEPLIKKSGDNTWLINGAVSLDKAARELNLPLPIERHDTFSGYVFSLLGRIPEDGSMMELEEEGLKIKILEIREHRLEKALVTVKGD